MKKDKKILAQKASDFIIKKSTIANGLKVLYLEADSALLQLMRVSERINAVFISAGVTTKDNLELGALKEYYDAIKRAQYYFNGFIDKMITDSTYGATKKEDKAACYDSWLADANDFALFSLLFFDRAYRDKEQLNAIFTFLRGLKSHGQFDEGDFSYFKVEEMEEQANAENKEEN